MKSRIKRSEEIEKKLAKFKALQNLSTILASLVAFLIAVSAIFDILAGGYFLAMWKLNVIMWMFLFFWISREHEKLWDKHFKLWDDYFALSDKFISFMDDLIKMGKEKNEKPKKKVLN